MMNGHFNFCGEKDKFFNKLAGKLVNLREKTKLGIYLSYHQNK